MIKFSLGVALFWVLAAGVASQRMMMMPGMMQSSIRHRHVMASGIPAPYDALRNPLSVNQRVIARGALVFKQNCAACHGPTGVGNGAAGQGLSPPPADLTRIGQMPMSGSDAYLYWTIAEGGAPVGSAMPPFKQALSGNDIWSVIVYLRARVSR